MMSIRVFVATESRPPWGPAAAFAALCLLSALALVGAAGCDGRPRRVAVSGQVLIDDQPLTQGVIQLIPEGTRPSQGVIGEDGRFTLSCYGGDDGVIPGTHRVTVTAMEIISPTRIKWFAPKKYADPQTSGITLEIDEREDDLIIELTWDGGQPYIEGSGRSTFDGGDE